MSKYDLFISYAQLDNQRLDGSDKGWIDLFHERLEIRLGQLLGEKPRIWRDRKLNGDEYFEPEIWNHLSESAFFLSVLSPAYIKSKWCSAELREFDQQTSLNGDAQASNKSRIFKVLKTPAPLDAHPQELQGLLGYEFFSWSDPEENHFREFNHETGPTKDNRYWDKLEDLAQDIQKQVESLKYPQPPAPEPSGKTIYLATTTSDLNQDRDRIRRELQLNGHRVLPDLRLIRNPGGSFRNEVNRDLAESQLAVHLIGAAYGMVPHGETKSAAEIQCELASARVGVDGFSQIVWMLPGLTSKDERQQKFINELSDHINLPKETVLMQSKLEDLKTFIHDTLNPPAPSPELQKVMSRQNDRCPALVYIVYDQPDSEAIGQIEDCLFKHAFEPLWLPDDDPKVHMEFLQQCDAVLIYCGNANDAWLQMKRVELLKLYGYRQTQPVKGFYLSGPRTRGKESFRVREGTVISHFAEFTCDSLKPFIEQIEKARGGRQ